LYVFDWTENGALDKSMAGRVPGGRRFAFFCLAAAAEAAVLRVGLYLLR
jgi:hypothetical protein